MIEIARLPADDRRELFHIWQMTYQNPEAAYVCINYTDRFSDEGEEAAASAHPLHFFQVDFRA